MAKRSGATREFPARKTTASRTQKSSASSRSAAYKTARIARARQNREIQQQKREKLMFALFVVVILVMLLIAILIFKKVIGDTTDTTPPTDDPNVSQNGDDTPSVGGYEISVEKAMINSGSLISVTSAYSKKADTLGNIYESRTGFFNEEKGKDVYSLYTTYNDLLLDKDALAALNNLADDLYKATNHNDLLVRKGYDSSSIAHSTGLCVDLGILSDSLQNYPLDHSDYASNFKWFFDNYYKYGFVLDEDADHDFCYRYVGIPHAYYMHKEGLSLDEYISKIRTQTLAFTTDSGEKYEISYTKVTGDAVTVTLPDENTEYYLSGDNKEGIILTIKVN